MSEGLEEDDGGGADVDDILGRVVAGVDLYLLHYESTASAGLTIGLHHAGLLDVL